jgi:hypothetical protein
MQARWYSDRRRRNSRKRWFTSLENCLGHLLNKERDAVSSFDNVLLNAFCQRLVASYSINERGDFSLREPVERE